MRILYILLFFIFTNYFSFGQVTIWSDNFNAGFNASWNIIDNGATNDTWFVTNNYNGNDLDGTPFAFVNSDAAGSVNMNEELITPSFDGTSYSSIILEFDHYYNKYSNDIADVDIWDGSSWVNVYHLASDIGSWGNPNHQTIDISAYINTSMKVKFHYYNANYDWYWAIDNVVITGFVLDYSSQWISMNVGSSDWCRGETRDVKVTVKNNGTQAWTDSSPDVNIGCKWDGDPDYLVRVNAGNLAPGAQQEYTLTMTAPTTIGANHLTFDVVKEGDCWFGNNNGSCGPGNLTYSTATTINNCPDCTWQLCLNDSYGDGWNGGTIEATVAGVSIGSWTLNSGTGPECHDIPINIGDNIVLNYTAGSYSYENVFVLYDSQGNIAYSDDGSSGSHSYTYSNTDCNPHPLTPNEQDCLGAIPICGDSYSTVNSYQGTGNVPLEISGSSSCLSTGELNDVWYIFTVQQTGNLTFTITPVDPNDDYDWAIFNLTNSNCSDIYTDASLEVSCNYSGTDGVTGPDGSTSLSSQGAGGTPFNDAIPVVQGDVYVINLSNFSSTQSGYTIDFSMSSGIVVDNTAPELQTILNAPTCGQNKITARFTENVDTLTVNAGDFSIAGPGGPYSITQVNSQSGTATDRDFELTLSNQLIAGGTYTLIFSGQVDDACGNQVTGNSLDFTVNGVSGNAVVNDASVVCASDANGTITASATGGSGTYTYAWSTGVTTATINNLVAGTYTVTVSDDVGICYDIIDAVVNPANSGSSIGTWTGAYDTDWLNCRNWGYGTIPDYTVDVLIPTGCPNYPVVPYDGLIKNAVGGACKSIKIENGASLSMTSGHYLTFDGASLTIESGGVLSVDGDLTFQNSASAATNGTINAYSNFNILSSSSVATAAGNIYISGNFTNNSWFTTSAGNVEFNGSALQEINGSSTTSFYDLTINKTGDLRLASNIKVRHNMDFTQGRIDIKDKNVDLTTTGTILNESNNNTFISTDGSGIKGQGAGTITATRTVSNVTNYNPANLGIEITTSDNLGNITIIRGQKIQIGSYTDGTGATIPTQGVERYYKVPGIGKLDVPHGIKVNMYYWDTELNGLSEVNLEGYQWITEGRSSSWWTPLDGSVNTTTNLVTTSGDPYGSYIYTSTWYGFTFSDKFTIGSNREPLPVELVNLKANCNDNGVELSWQTLSEKNNDYFSILKSTNGNYFNEIGIIDGNGNSNELIDYSFTDYNIYNGITYYKLIQTDFDNTASESKIVTADCSSSIYRETIFNLYPNPSINGKNVYLEINNAEKEAEVLVVINDILGNQLYSKVIITDVNGSTVTAIDRLNKLAPGTYIIIATSKNKLYKKKLIIN